MASELLSVENLTVEADIEGRVVRPVDGVSLHLSPGETLGVVGESGSGKTMTMLAVLRLLPSFPRWRTSGRILLQGSDVLALSDRELRAVRGRDISLVLQNPSRALNPAFRVGAQLSEGVAAHNAHRLSGPQIRERSIDMLRQVGIADPAKRFRQFPHEYSGGMAQRAVTAMALINEPGVVVADEPTTGLDVTIQAQVIALLKGLLRDRNIGLILISHDLGLIGDIADRVMVMYAGQVVEEGSIDELFNTPRHPYTVGLIRSIPPLDRRLERLQSIAGQPASGSQQITGCRFHPRCPLARPLCERTEPALTRVAPSGHQSACHYWQEVGLS